MGDDNEKNQQPKRAGFFSGKGEANKAPEPSYLIFNKMTPQEGRQLLAAHNKKNPQNTKRAILRESSFPGMLSVDIGEEENFKAESFRFAFFEGKGWKVMDWQNARAYQNLIKPITLSTKDLENYVGQLFDCIASVCRWQTKTPVNLTLDDFIVPSEHQATRNNMYEAYRSVAYPENPEDAKVVEDDQDVVLEAEKKLSIECPITGESMQQIIDRGGHVAMLNNRYYDREKIVEWVSNKRTDPITRESVELDDIKDTSVFNRLAAHVSPKSFP